GETAHSSHREHVQHDRGQQVHRIGGQYGTPGAGPAQIHGILQASAFAHFIAYSFEVNDEGVLSDTDRDDQTRHTGQGQSVPDQLRQPGDRPIAERAGDQQAQQGHQGQATVLDDRVDDHQQQPDEPGDEPALELDGTEGGGDLRLAAQFEGDRQRTVVQLVRQGNGF